MGDSFRANAWDSQLDTMLDDLQQVTTIFFHVHVHSKKTNSTPSLQSVQTGHSESPRITNGHNGHNGQTSHEYQVTHRRPNLNNLL